MLQSIVISLSTDQLSDLFFNYEHPEYSKYICGNEPKVIPINEAAAIALGDYSSGLYQAIAKDATEFLLTIGNPTNISAFDLATDFMERLGMRECWINVYWHPLNNCIYYGDVNWRKSLAVSISRITHYKLLYRIHVRMR